MFLRKLRVHKDGKEHSYWSLVEMVRTADGPRQRTLCYLGELNGSAHARLGYALLVTLKHLLKRVGSEYSPAKALQRLSELYSVDIVLPTIEGREIWLRRISKLDQEQQKILHQLQLQLPERLEPIQILKCSENSAIA